jgi:hypothetical protein
VPAISGSPDSLTFGLWTPAGDHSDQARVVTTVFFGLPVAEHRSTFSACPTRVYIPRGTTLRAAAQRERMSSEEVERLKAELAAVKGRAVTKIKQQAQQIVEQQQQLAELRTQLEHVSGATPSNSSDSPSSSGEGDKERFVKVARDGEHSRVRHRGEMGRSETGSSKAAPAWHAALLEGLHTIQQSLVAQ